MPAGFFITRCEESRNISLKILIFSSLPFYGMQEVYQIPLANEEKL